GHRGPARDERLRADVKRLAADPFRAQHAAHSVRRIEHGDRRVRPRCDPQPIGRYEPRNPAPDNGIRWIHWECTSSTTRVITAGSVLGNTPWPRLNTWPAAPAST